MIRRITGPRNPNMTLSVSTKCHERLVSDGLLANSSESADSLESVVNRVCTAGAEECGGDGADPECEADDVRCRVGDVRRALQHRDRLDQLGRHCCGDSDRVHAYDAAR